MGVLKQQHEKEESKQGEAPSLIEQVDEKVATATGSTSLILRYTPKSHRKDDESPFSECTICKSITKPSIKVEEAN